MKAVLDGRQLALKVSANRCTLLRCNGISAAASQLRYMIISGSIVLNEDAAIVRCSCQSHQALEVQSGQCNAVYTDLLGRLLGSCLASRFLHQPLRTAAS